ncbi:Acyl-[acyl-carrier-protein]--UDP-N-acetylglucosamine O-acyltransferase [Limihaloglobus sulfuriphilus]|uniref:Acyl-[acyl-carrier-protein]--UDP-N-acetylglucosamine O-acyltransferase n=1 Tax=Limihaloglobus sulfuriphilus TaxID=1851148 RepID=A0A1Q2MBJ8_9BACT|nr:acyl-ACP--UDP-N-acetylglucosamine O-acyltransferase [Limihaloglobus sulfuriphilus]AQQ70105.1 Acyl-[acyl-carrier-protein]--UDP-N-acetylglucosamine O-acyltransferase [Limihaloglobus sulfuriphilus]
MSDTIIHPTAVVEDSAVIGSGTVVGPNCYVGSNVKIGNNNELQANAVIGDGTVLGNGNRLFSNCVIGRGPQIFVMDPNAKYGKLEIGDNNTFRENSTVHPSMHEGGLTKIGSGNFIMIGVHIGHDCIIENQIVMSNFSQISGHSKVETGAWLSGMVVTHQFVTIGKWSYCTGLTGVNKDLPPYLIGNGHYPFRVRSVNERGMNRSGLNEEEKKAVWDAFKYLYRQKSGSVLSRAKELAEKDNQICVKEIVEAVINSSKHKNGRYLETFR